MARLKALEAKRGSGLIRCNAFTADHPLLECNLMLQKCHQGDQRSRLGRPKTIFGEICFTLSLRQLIDRQFQSFGGQILEFLHRWKRKYLHSMDETNEKVLQMFDVIVFIKRGQFGERLLNVFPDGFFGLAFVMLWGFASLKRNSGISRNEKRRINK